ncbi:MAG: hypothetical protein H0U65_00430 [Rubrobacter sp.]|jgi:DNA-directed RNA polymerase specialized sigma54-like protein|nr:hypothetical protein [Rubrobacter sp.]
MVDSKDIDRMTGATREMAEAQREAQEAVAENFMASQKRGMDVARDGLKFMELQRDNASAAQEWWSSGTRLMKLQQRNAEFAQRWMSGAADAMRGQAEQNVRTAEVFAKSYRAQQESFRTLAQTWVGAYQNALSSFAGYAQEGVKVAEKATEQGAEITKQATEQGMRLVDNAADTASQAASQNGSQNGSAAKSVLISALDDGGYDEMNVGDITKNLDSLSEDELKKVRTYEKRHKNRDTLVEQIDRKIKANS